jgi:RimJ/RimL family protein N-acetyltransferase
MIYELNIPAYENVRELFAGLNYHLVIFSIIEGHSPGQIWVDRLDRPQTALVWDKVEGGFYLAGDERNDEVNAALNQCILQEIYPAAKKLPHCLDFELNYDPAAWENKFDVVLRDIFALKHYRQHFRCTRLTFDWRAQLPAGFTLVRLDRDFLSQTHLKNMDKVTTWVLGNWQSVENFVAKGLGVCLVRGDEIASWSVADYTAGQAYEIGIHTDEAYRRQGLATLTTAAAVEYCFERGAVEVGWHCWSENTASAATARKVGFEQTVEHPVYHAWYNRFDNFLVQGWANVQRQNYQAAATAYEAAFKMREAGDQEAAASHIWADGETVGWCYYHTARAWALIGNGDAAFKYLHQAIRQGWSHSERLHNDEAWQDLRQDKRWTELLKINVLGGDLS